MADILIRGMEMPIMCKDCPCFYPEYNECNAIVGRWVDGKGTPPFDCPLVPVPPHGRLIDADALHYSRIRIAHEDGTIGGYNAVVMSSEIKDALTVIPADEEGE